MAQKKTKRQQREAMQSALSAAGIAGPSLRQDPNHLRALGHRVSSTPPANPRAVAAKTACRRFSTDD